MTPPSSTGSVGAIYPGSFDPVTNGHLDIIERASTIFDRVVVAVLTHRDKNPLFSVQERLDMLRNVTKRWNNVEVDQFEGLLVNFARACDARVVVRGIRAVTDFDYEFQMALMNRRIDPTIETVFLTPAETYSYLSSSLIKQVSELGGSVTGLVPDVVEQALLQRLG